MIVKLEDDRVFNVVWRYSHEQRPGKKGRVEFHRKNTACYITDVEKGDEYVGDALLHFRDKFNPEKGRKIALAGALKALHFDKPDRETFWLAYFNRKSLDKEHEACYTLDKEF